MKQRNSLHAARDQIVWIITLVASTAVVVHLERLDLEQPQSTLTENPFSTSTAKVTALLESIEANSSNSDEALVQRATALTFGMLSDEPTDELRANARSTLLAIEKRLLQQDDPVLRSAYELLTGALDADVPRK